MSGIMNTIQVALGEILYTLLVHPFFFVINTADNIFRALAGIDSSTQLIGSEATKDGIDLDGGVVYDLLKTDLIKKIFIAILVLAIFLLVIFTVMAFLKNVYAQKQKTSKEIISNSLKGLIYFIFVPVCTLLGVYLGNIVLRAVNGATSNAGAGGNSIVGTLFIAGAYDANRWRGSNAQEVTAEDKNALKDLAGNDYASEIDKANTPAEFADVVDHFFASADERESIYWQPTVDNYYRTHNFNFIIIIVGGCFVAYVMCSLAFAMARRIFIMLIWFVISPACCAMFPIDEGKMVGKYKDEMTKQVLSAYGAVAGVNLFLSVMPLIDNIQITNLKPGATGLVSLFIQICGLLCVKELVSALSSLVGGEDALAKGSSLMKSTTGAIKKYGGGALKKTVATGTKLASNFKQYGILGKKGNLASLKNPATWKYSGIGGALSMGMNSLSKGLLGVDIESDVIKTFRDTTKAEKEETKIARAKKVKKAYFADHKDEIKKSMTGEQIYKFVKDGAEMGVTLDDLIEKLREAKGGLRTDEEKVIRAKYTDYRDYIAEKDRVTAMNGPSVQANLDSSSKAAQEAQDNLQEATGTAGKTINEFKDKKDYETKAKAITIRNANVAIDKGDAEAAKKAVGGLEKGDEFRIKVEAVAGAIEAQKVAEEAAKTTLEEFRQSLEKFTHIFPQAADALKSFVSETTKDNGKKGGGNDDTAKIANAIKTAAKEALDSIKPEESKKS